MGRHLRTVIGGLLLWAGIGGATAVAADKPDAGPGAPVSRDLVHLPIVSSAQHDNTRRMAIPPGPKVPDQRTNVRPTGLGPSAPYANAPGVWDEKSWISWWETNRDAVLPRVIARHAAQAPRSSTADNKPPPERERAAAALLKATWGEHPDLRAAAAVSLGQIRQADALKRLVEMGQKDEDAYVRGMSWLAVGLIGTPEAEKALLSVRPRDEFEQLGVIAGIGMLDRPGEPAFQMLHGLIAQPPSPEVGRAAVWALRVFHRPADHDAIVAAMASGAAPPPVIAEGLLALGAIGDARDVDALADVASAGRAAAANDRVVVNGGGAYVRRNATYQHPEPHGLDGRPSAGGRSTTMIRRQPQDVASPSRFGARTPVTRTSAALALGPSATGRSPAAGSARAQNALIQNFAPYLDQGGPMYAGASVIAFAAAATSKDVYILRDLVDMGTDPVLGLVNPKSPLRGYAAIGLGLYMANGGASKIETRPLGTVQVGVDPGLPDYLDLNETLALRYANRQESQDLRAACALALGLSGDPANVQRLLKGAERIDRRDELLLGYTALALAMLGERSAVNAAGPLVSAGATTLDADAVATRGLGQLYPAPAARGATPADPSLFAAPPVPQSGVGLMNALGRRAALFGLSLLDDPRSEAILTGAWARDRATVQDVARAMQWRHAYKPADALAQVVARGRKGAAEAAMSLGWVFDTDRPSRLSRFVIGNNYHAPQADWSDQPAGSQYMIRNFLRVGDSFLYSTPVGGDPVPPRLASPTTRRSAAP